MELLTKQETLELFEALHAEIRDLRGQLARPVADGQANFRRDEAAKYLGVSVRTLDTLSAKGEIPRARIGHGQTSVVLFRRADLDAYIDAHMEMDAKAARLKVIGG